MKPRRHMKRLPRQKRERVIHRNRLQPARRFLLRPDPDRPFVVELRLAASPRRMRDEMRRIEGPKADTDRRCAGLVRHWMSKITGRHVVRPGQVIARMYLNAVDLRRQPSEIVAHECTHAGMAWARLQRANLRRMEGEEVLCYAVGRLVAQVNHIGYAAGVFR